MAILEVIQDRIIVEGIANIEKGMKKLKLELKEEMKEARRERQTYG